MSTTSGAGGARITIGDVAARAGVSIATVSRVVNDRYGVAPETSVRVREVIDELGYESSLIARSLRSQRTNVIGILVADIEPFSAELLKGAARALHESGFELVVYSGGMPGARGGSAATCHGSSGTLTDGTILVTPTRRRRRARPIPIVAVDPHVGGSALPTVDSQNFEGARDATEHLIALGHRRIGFLAGRPDLESARRREAGYRAALEAAGIAFDPELIRVGGFTEETADAPAACAARARRPADRDLRRQRPVGDPDDAHRRRARARRAPRPLGGRLRQHPRVGAHRSAADDGRPVDPGARPRGGAHPHRPDREPRTARRVIADARHAADRARRPPLVRRAPATP